MRWGLAMLCLIVLASCQPKNGAREMGYTRETLLERIAQLYSDRGYESILCDPKLGDPKASRCFLTNEFPQRIEEDLKEFSDFNLVKLGDWEFMPQAAYLKFKYNGDKHYYVALSVIDTKNWTAKERLASGFSKVLVIDIDETQAR